MVPLSVLEHNTRAVTVELNLFSVMGGMDVNYSVILLLISAFALIILHGLPLTTGRYLFYLVIFLFPPLIQCVYSLMNVSEQFAYWTILFKYSSIKTVR